MDSGFVAVGTEGSESPSPQQEEGRPEEARRPPDASQHRLEFRSHKTPPTVGIDRTLHSHVIRVEEQERPLLPAPTEAKP